MKLKTEIIEDKQKILVISRKYYPLIDDLKHLFKKFNVDYFYSPFLPKKVDDFDYLFFINDSPKEEIFHLKNKKITFLYLKKKAPEFLKKKKNIKIIETTNDKINKENIDRILWFVFSLSQENYLKIYQLEKQKKTFSFNKKIPNFLLTPKKIFLTFFFFLIFFHLLFFPFILFSYFYLYRSYLDFKKNDFLNLEKNFFWAKRYSRIGLNLYDLPQKNFRLLGISYYPDKLVDVNDSLVSVFEKLLKIIDLTKKTQNLVFLKNKDEYQKENLKIYFFKLKENLQEIENLSILISQKIDLPIKKIKEKQNELLEFVDLLKKGEDFLAYLEKIIFQEKKTKFLLFFSNNMELRPGGGFLGSLAVLEMGNYQVDDLKVYDVYDIDGQLTFHIDPPKPLAKYLNLPHLFLRDSNFTPDFTENYQKALFFMEKSMKMTDFNGGILLTTTAVQNILEAFGDIYLPDFKKNINAKNFYLTTQTQVEKDFFPGSIQKKSFLSSVLRNLIINFDKVDLNKLIFALKKSLDEKQMVIVVDDEKMMSVLTKYFWSGKIIAPKCLLATDCLSDYLFPYDFNVGANKANFFINKSFYLKTNINFQGEINHLLTITYQNNALSNEMFPAGIYRNYLQVLLPVDVEIKSISKDDVLIDEYDQKDDVYKNIGFFFEVKPKEKTEIKIQYKLKERLTKKQQIYQLIFQKQIGDQNNDLILDFQIAQNYSLINHNFSPLVKEGKIVYNTNLLTDKIFFIEFKNNNL